MRLVDDAGYFRSVDLKQSRPTAGIARLWIVERKRSHEV